MSHTHIFQTKPGHPIKGCPACAVVNPWHQSRDYARSAYAELTLKAVS